MRRTALSWGRLVAPAIVLAILVWRLGASPFIAGPSLGQRRAVAAAVGLAVLTTVCCAWRWKIVAGGLGLDLPLSAAARLRGAAAQDIRGGLFARRAWPSIAFASALVVAGHAPTFLLAARPAGVSAPPSQVLPIALLVMAAMVLPSIGGWGPREGVTAWAFGAAWLGAQRRDATAVVYGVMVLVASLPGAVVLVMAWFRRNRPPARTQPSLRGRTAHA
jgi:hypothetical protein